MNGNRSGGDGLRATAPASHEVYPLFEREGEDQALVVVPVPPREMP